ncbi:MAG: hypothetical protein DWQ37_22770 [Planctomycetota bacterium]|nr:MAG: hypothetical protein DWQ37_22770 [Planctomycetota bacterium]
MAKSSDKNTPAKNDSAHEDEQAPRDLTDHLVEYARENPGTACLWCLGIGFILGWKLKPW